MSEISRPSPASPPAFAATVPAAPMQRWLFGIVSLAIFLIVGTTGLAIFRSQVEHQERATVSARNLSRVLDQSITGVIDKVDLALRAAILDLEKQFGAAAIDGSRITALLVQHQALVPDLLSLRIADDAGRVRFGAGVSDAPPVNIGDRDFFIRLRDDAKAGVVVSGPVLARISRTWVIVVARRLTRPDGSFAGVIYANIATSHLQRMFSEIDLGRQGAISLRTTDLRLVARYPDPQGGSATGTSNVSSQFRSAVQNASEAGSFVAAAPIDGIERAIAYRKLARYPYYIIVGLGSDDYRAAWLEDAWRNGALAALAILLTLGAGEMLRRAWLRQAKVSGALARESYRNQLLLRTASDGIHVVDTEGRVLEASDSFCKLLGYERCELMQMQVAQWDARWSAEELRKVLAELVSSRAHAVFETRHRRRDGSVIDVEITATAVELDGSTVIYGSARDITERKRAESALRASEHQQRRVIEGSDQGVWDWDLASNCFSVSARFETMLGYAPGEMDVSVANWPNLIEPGDLARANESIARHLAGESPAHEVEVRCRGKSGQWHWLLTRGRIVEWDAEGHPAIMSGTFTDISERKQGELALKAAMAEAEKANRDKSRFLAAASHDLRQPLSALSLYVGVLKQQTQADGAKVVARIQNCVDSLSELLSDLLDVSKLEAGVVTPKPADFAIEPLLQALVSIHAGEARLKGLRLRLRTTRAFVAHTDSILLRRILGNFVANAIRYTDRGGVLIACRRREGRHWVEVWDTGIGIPQDKTALVFEAFTQLGDDARSRGSGLGLAIVEKTAKLLGVEIRLRSRPGRGSMFAIELPPGESAALQTVAAPIPLASRRIAVVDDNTDVLSALELTLESAGHEVVAARSGRELLDRLGGRRPELVVSDYRLAKGETGFEVVEAVRGAFGESVAALIITGDTDPVLIRSMADRGIAVYYKPLRPEALLAAIREALKHPSRDVMHRD